MIEFSKTIFYFTFFKNKQTKKDQIKFAGAKKCDDYHWGTLKKGKVRRRKKTVGTALNVNTLKNNNVIVIVGESPHRDEYRVSKGVCTTFTRPLYRCDAKIKKYLKKNSYNWFNSSLDYDVVIVNAIQYQCSFGLGLWGHPNNQRQRDEIFEWTWCHQPAKQDLLDRITDIIYGKTNVIILNCCTKNLKKYCNASLFQKTNPNQNFLVFDESHPSVWK